MTRQLAKVNTGNGREFVVIYDDKEKYNPFKLYVKGYGKDGNYHKELCDKYADYRSCIFAIAHAI